MDRRISPPLAFLLLVLGAFSSLSSLADVRTFQQTFYAPDYDQGFLLLDYHYFDESLDVLDYSSKLSSTFKPESATSTYLGLGYRFFEKGLISYQRERSKGKITRDREPYLLESKVDGDRLGIRWQIGSRFNVNWSLELAYLSREQPEVAIKCYEFQGSVFGACSDSTLSFADPITDAPLPLLESDAQQSTWAATLFANHELFDRLNVTHHVLIKQSDLEINTRSPLFDIESPFLLNSSFGGRKLSEIITGFKQDLPQQTPWKETSFRYGVSGGLLLSDRWIANVQLAVTKVKRSGYQWVEGNPNYESNTILSTSLWYTPIQNVSLYVEGMVTQHYLLGIDELTYNQRTSRFFEHPFAQIKTGFVLGF
ncbi:MAG: hypothetical protein VW684_13530 [Betaproteobacteria bacterium]